MTYPSEQSWRRLSQPTIIGIRQHPRCPFPVVSPHNLWTRKRHVRVVHTSSSVWIPAEFCADYEIGQMPPSCQQALRVARRSRYVLRDSLRTMITIYLLTAASMRYEELGSICDTELDDSL